MNLSLLLFLPAFLLCGCHVKNDGILHSRFAYALSKPRADAKIEFKKNEPKFLRLDGGSMEPFFVPGLNQSETDEFIDSGRFGTIQFHNYHLEFIEKDSKEAKQIEAKMKYAASFNKELLNLIKTKKHIKAADTTATSRRVSP